MKRTLSLVLSLVLVCSIFSCLSVTVNAASTSNLTFKLSEDGNSYSVSACSEYASGSLTIPATYNGKPITSIGEGAFYYCDSLTSIAIPDSVTSIGNFAFRHCTRLTSVTIGNCVTSIGSYAFHDCTSLTSITIPDSVTSIGDSAFYDCTRLTSVTIGNSVTSIGTQAFYYCISLEKIYWNAKNISGFTESSNLFYNAGTSGTGIKVVFGDTVERIPAYLFYVSNSSYRPKLTKVTIGDSVTSIDGSAFSNCTSLNAVYITDLAKWCNIEFGSSNANPLYYAKNLYINGELATDIVIPDSVTNISAYAFRNCTSLTSITIPDSVTSIGGSAFYNTGYYNDTSNWENDVLYIGNHLIKAKGTLSGNYAIKDGTKTIAYSAFSSCKSLTSITIPDSVTSIGNYAFYDCTSLTSITIPDSVTNIGDSAFGYCQSLTSITIPDSVTSIGNSDFYGCTSLTSITIPDSVTSIGYNAFYNTGYYNDSGNWLKGVLYINNHLIKAKTSIVAENTIKEGTITIADNAFADCIGLTTFIIPNSVTSIGSYAFSGCTSLTAITLPENLTNIGGSAFYNCTSLTSVTIPNSVTSIGNGAFGKCTSLTFITIPDSVTSIGSSAFSFCRSLTSITIPDGVTSIGNFAFYDCTSLTSITIPDSVTSIGVRAFYNCDSLTSITIPDSVMSIGEETFRSCTSLASVTIGNGVTCIGNYAFSGCTNLTSLTIPEKVTSIGSYAFRSCTNLKQIYWNAKNVDGFTSSSEVFYGAGSSGIGIEVIFGDTVEKIPAYLFYVSSASNKPNVTKVTLGENVTNIGAYAFYNFVGINSIIIPDSVTSIGSYAFNGCTGLKSVTVGKGVTNIGYYAFNGCINLKNVYYRGLLIDWGDITVGSGNNCLLDATFSHLCTYNNWIIDTAATCEETGSKHGVCIVCGETVTEVIPALGHLSSTWIIDKTATCGDIGRKHKNCILCGVVTETEIIPATGEHVSSGWKIDAAATVSVPGSKHTECTVCGTRLETAVIPQLKPATPKVKAMNTIKGMKVTWNAVDGAVKYGLYKRLGTANTWTFVTTTTATSYADNNASYAGSYYVYTVKAYNSAGTPSDYVKANCAAVQRVIAPYTYASNTVDGISVTWSKVAGANKYVVLRRLGTGSVWETLCTTTGTSYLDKNVTPGIYYLYSIRAVNNTGYSEYDVNKRVTIKRASYKPDTPTATATNLANGVQVKWNSVTGATKYNVYRRVGGSSSWVLVGTTTGTSLVDKGVTNGKYYVYSIRAINSAGYSAFDTKKTVTIQPITAPTPKLVNKSNGVHVSWNAVAGATKYNVYRRAAGSSTWVYVGSATGTGGLDTGVAKGNYYAYSIRAINGTGYSAYNSSKCASIKHS